MATDIVKRNSLTYLQDANSLSISAQTNTNVCSLTLSPGVWYLTFYTRAGTSNSGSMNVSFYNLTDSRTVRTPMTNGGGCMTSAIETITSETTVYGRVWFNVATTATSELNAIKIA